MPQMALIHCSGRASSQKGHWAGEWEESGRYSKPGPSLPKPVREPIIVEVNWVKDEQTGKSKMKGTFKGTTSS